MPFFCGCSSLSGWHLTELLEYSRSLLLPTEHFGFSLEDGVALCSSSADRTRPYPFRYRYGNHFLAIACVGWAKTSKGSLYTGQNEAALLSLYVRHGIKMRRFLMGDYAFVIHDNAKGRLFFATSPNRKIWIGAQKGEFWFSSAPILPHTTEADIGLYRLR
ncbi:MAG: hypothetical protein J6K61_01000 [Clostridia bacterium]|nr:hypothetical protein [Clostridia bacterium]